MKLLFWRNKKQSARLDELEREATATHKKNITKIVNTRHKVDTLNVALKQNNIVFQLASVTGNHR